MLYLKQWERDLNKKQTARPAIQAAPLALDRRYPSPYNALEICKEVFMDIFRKLGIGIVFIIPSFVLGGALWAMIESWFGVLVLEVVMAGFYFSIVRRNPAESRQEAESA